MAIYISYMTQSSEMTPPFEVFVTLRRPHLPGVGRDRIQLLEAVAESGSISAGARTVGITYKAAWHALAAMGEVFGAPVISTQVGGRSGGGARLTVAGERVIDAYRQIERETCRALRGVEPLLNGAFADPFNATFPREKPDVDA